MMTSGEIRQHFFNFFKSKGHSIVPSAPIVIKDDPTLLFTNAGMNQFKDYFLGNKKPAYTRVADTQKCLRVSGKHNDLEEVGVDTYHHTMFEMLGNWSFGNAEGSPAPYFKEEAIAWSWELLTGIYKIEKDRLYVSVFEGDVKENLPKDDEAIGFWKKWIAEDRIIMGNKKDNFWEMGDIGPCGPCTEIHVDTRTDEERKKIDGKGLVNNDHAEVIEIWNNVFIQYNRKKDGSLEALPAKHVDTGMGFERLVRVLQNKQSNYDTDIFTGTIAEVETLSGKKYTNTDNKPDVAFRVIADHIRAISFPIADGQFPSNTGAGYVIRRILRRAARYYFSYLDVKEPLLYKLIPSLAEQFKNVFPELSKQSDFISKVVHEEEEAFLRTLDNALSKSNNIIHSAFVDGLKKNLIQNNYTVLDQRDVIKQPFDLVVKTQDGDFAVEVKSREINNSDSDAKAMAYGIKKVLDIDSTAGVKNNKTIDAFKDFFKLKDINYSFFSINGKNSFELYDTYGFPLDLTKLIVSEKGLLVDEIAFNEEMQQQKNRSRTAGVINTEDWIQVGPYSGSDFIGYENYETQKELTKYRKISSKGKTQYQFVFAQTPFYSESGGQVGDKGVLIFNDELIEVVDTKRENDLIVHFTEKLPKILTGKITLRIDRNIRKATAIHHSATHLMHAALRNVLGKHVAQKGSLVNDEYLRFDFSHFTKVTDEELATIEAMVNENIRKNIPVVIKEMKKEEALATGAMALFGEKYGDMVRVVIIDPNYSIELCGGTHVGNTGELGIFKIKHETAVGAGVRRIEAVSGQVAEDYINQQFDLIRAIRDRLKNPKDIVKSIENLSAENSELKKNNDRLESKNIITVKDELLNKVQIVNGINFIGEIVEISNADALKKICFSLKNELNNYAVVLAAIIDGKPNVAVMLDDSIALSKNLDASKIIKEYIAPLIKGGGGGQKTLATAGGQDATKLTEVIEKVKSLF